jgi:hypothetical protein
MDTGRGNEKTLPGSLLASLPWMVVFLLGLVDLARGSFHWLAPDSGAGSVAGMSLAYPDAANVIFLLSLSGLSQIFFGIWFIYIALRQRALVPLALGAEAALSALVLLTEYVLKPPVSPVPGQYAHWAPLIISAIALIVYYFYIKRKTRAKS